MMQLDAHPEAGALQGPEVSDGEGMSVDDAVSSSFDDWDRNAHGIAESEREPLGKNLKYHADAVGTTVIGGLNTLIDTAVGLNTGDQQRKREVIGHLIDNYGVRAEPMADDPAPMNQNEGQQPIGTEAEGMAVVEDFIANNPVARDERIQGHMLHILNDMGRQGYQPNLGQAFQIAVSSDARYSQQAQAETDAQHLARAKAAGGQVSGGGITSPRGGSDDIGDILNEMIP